MARFLKERDDAQKEIGALKKELESSKKESLELVEKKRKLHEEKLPQMTEREAELERRLRASSASLSGECDTSRSCTINLVDWMC